MKTSRSTWIIAGLILVAAAFLGLIAMAVIGFEVGINGFVIGFLMASVPVPFYVAFALWVDRFEPEPAWLLALAFVWGAAIAVFFSLIFNSLNEGILTAVAGAASASTLTAVLSAPFVEELTKGAALLLLFVWKRDEFDNVTDGIVYATMVGLGFAMTENVQYYGRAVAEGSGGAMAVFFMRGVMGPFAHPLFTSMTGIGLGLASHARGRAARLLLPPAGLALAVLLHAAWNASAFFTGATENGLIMLGSYFVVMVPTFVSLLAVVGFALRREGRVLREQLRADCERGLFTHDEYLRLCSLRQRAGASFGALTRRGLAAWRARMRLNRAASELAFHRHRVARGVTSRDGRDAEREAVYLRQIHELLKSSHQ